MKQFVKARLRLTTWYTTILLMVSLFLSGIYYSRTIRMIELQYHQIENRFTDRPPMGGRGLGFQERLELLDDEFTSIQDFLKKQLFIINGFVFLIGGFSSYFLAGKTLYPIQKSLEKQKSFVANAAHELKTPLTAIKTSLEVSLMSKKINSESKKIIKENLEDVDSLTRLTENLLSLARIEEDDFVLSFENVDLSKVVSRAVGHVRPLAKLKNIKIIVSHKKNLSIFGNEDALVEVLMVILDNAIKYSNKDTTIKLVIGNKGKKNFIKVIDQGMGIDKKHLSQIFDRFYRVDQARVNHSGYGLGLSVAKKIMNQHDGSIDVESTLAKGSTFTLVF
jgi:two-component system sensor histidine kinase CiaH